MNQDPYVIVMLAPNRYSYYCGTDFSKNLNHWTKNLDDAYLYQSYDECRLCIFICNLDRCLWDIMVLKRSEVSKSWLNT